VSVVSVASPDLFHVEHCVAAMRAGKDVLCEKPMALSVAECSEIIRAADGKGDGSLFSSGSCPAILRSHKEL